MRPKAKQKTKIPRKARLSVKLPQTLRDELKVPLGTLVPDNQVNYASISAHTANAAHIITVGDKTTEKLIEFGIVADLQITDGQERRLYRNQPKLATGTIKMTCQNPAGQITDQSVSKIKKAFLSSVPVRLEVTGEEDLLVLPVCIYAPDNSVVLYGQPNEGMVIVCIDDKIRQKTQRLVDSMKPGE